MSFGFKLIVPCALTLYLAAACVPDLDSLSANYSATSSGGTGGIDENPEGGSGNATSGGGPAVDPCFNNRKDAKESDVDCGGTSVCDRCAAGSKCTANADCDSSYCKGNICTTPTCKDRVKNQDESGVDCGGHCAPCDLGNSCQSNGDCDSDYCIEESKTCGDHCTSGALEDNETDVDCGGSCGPCDDKLKCLVGTDCTSQICFNAKCAVPSCSDSVLNGTESDVDCGGSCADSGKGCGVNAKCNSEADCTSWICSKTTSKCLSDTTVVAADAIIDDFEDGDFSLPALGTPVRVGGWYPYGDGSGVITEEVLTIKRGASIKGLHGSGKKFTGWGSGVGADLNNKGTKGTWNASAYTALTFWARVSEPMTGLNVVVAVPDLDTDKLTVGHTCDGDNNGCDHHYFKGISLTTSWQRFVIPFADLTLETGAKLADGTTPFPAFKPEAISSVQFRVNSGIDYDLYVDDIGFVKP